MNKEKLVPVDMKIGELIDAMNDGRRFRIKGADLGVIFNRSLAPSCIETHPDCFDVYCMGFTALEIHLQYGSILEEVEMTWQECLDGSWENGQWCKVSGYDDYAFVKILRITKDYYLAKESHLHADQHTFTPCSEELSTLLEVEGESL